MANFVCTTCFKAKDEILQLHWVDNKQVCNRCYFKFIKYEKLRSDLPDDERKKILEELLNMEGKKYGNVM